MTAAETDLSEGLAGWAPDPVEMTETVTAGPAVALAGLLDTDPPVNGSGDRLPPLWHWVYFLDRPAQRELGPDGHPAAGHFIPPIPRRRRMFAGSRVDYFAPICCGDRLTRRSDLAEWTIKHGRTGQLLFVTVRHAFYRTGVLVLREEQDLVYRNAEDAGSPGHGAVRPLDDTGHRPASESVSPHDAWRMRLAADPVLLFRFSALTYNAHRIHYDAAYATEIEGHPGLVVQGPLLALLGLELPRRHLPDRPVTQVSLRARAPIYARDTFTVTADRRDGECRIRVSTPDGSDAMTAQAHLAP